MPLRLVLGPANARKTGWLLDAHTAAVEAGKTAWLVVPSSGDAERIERELAGIDGPPGVSRRAPQPLATVVTTAGFDRLLRGRLQIEGRPLPRHQREAVALSAIAATDLELLEPAARSGWLAGALTRLREELLASGTPIAEATRGLRDWSARVHDTRGTELAALLEADEQRLLRLRDAGWTDHGVATERIVAALRGVAPANLDGLHVAFAGFDDLAPTQRAVVVALGHTDAEVVLSLPYVEGRAAFAAARELVDDLAAGQTAVTELNTAEATHERTDLLAAVEQRLFEPDVYVAPAAHDAAQLSFASRITDDSGVVTLGGEPGAANGDAPPPTHEDDSVTVLRGGGPDEERALIADHLRALTGEHDVAPEAIAVVVASAAVEGPAVVRALRRAGLPAHLAASRPARAQPSVAALRALLHAVGPRGTAADLVRWLGGPGGPEQVSELDAVVRRQGARGKNDALRLWARLGGRRLAEYDALASATGPGELPEAAAAALRARIVAVSQRHATPDIGVQVDLRATAGLLSALDDLAAFQRDAQALGLDLVLSPDDLIHLIDELPASGGREPVGSIAVVDPLGVRTRHLDTVVLAHAQWGRYPAEEPRRVLLSRADRAQLATDHGWPPVRTASHIDSQRHLTYAIVTRPARRLVVSWHDGDGDGNSAERSMLLAELDRIAGRAIEPRAMDVGTAGYLAASGERRARLQAARDGERHREVQHERSPLLAAESHEEGHGVRAIQTAARCPAQWLAEHRLAPEELRPDADPLTAGRLRHEVLKNVVASVVADGIRLGPDARGPLGQALAAEAQRLADEGARRRETVPERVLRERVIAEVEATLPTLYADELAHQPQEFELAFGGRSGGDEARPPIVIERGGEQLRLAGRIDRIDISDEREVVVVDYKGAEVAGYAAARWVPMRELQAGLYAIAAAQMLGDGARPVGSLYQAVPGTAARGGAGVPLGGRAVSRHDALGDDWETLLDELVTLALEAQRVIDDGIVKPEPATCSPGGCRYPWLCRGVDR